MAALIRVQGGVKREMQFTPYVARAVLAIVGILPCMTSYSVMADIQAVIADSDEYVIGTSDYLLVELSDFAMSPAIFKALEQLVGMGIRPIITHPERNPILQKSPERVLEWVEMGVVVQVTASAFTGSWGDATRRSALWLLERDAVHVMASDCHDVKHRTPGLSAGRDTVAEIAGEDVANALVDDNPRAVVNSQVLPYFPKPVRK